MAHWIYLTAYFGFAAAWILLIGHSVLWAIRHPDKFQGMVEDSKERIPGDW
jgi:hypothetical protein